MGGWVVGWVRMVRMGVVLLDPKVVPCLPAGTLHMEQAVRK